MNDEARQSLESIDREIEGRRVGRDFVHLLKLSSPGSLHVPLDLIKLDRKRDSYCLDLPLFIDV